jgi:hypothetical protein
MSVSAETPWVRDEIVVLADPDARLRVGPDGAVQSAMEVDELRAFLREANVTLRPLATYDGGNVRPRAGDRSAYVDFAAPDLSRYFSVAYPNVAPADAFVDAPVRLAEELGRLSAIERAVHKPPIRPAAPPPLPTPTPDFSDRQGYLGSAPLGIGAQTAWNRPGGKGEDVRIIDVEGEWRLTHEDLRAMAPTLVSGKAPGDLEWRNHGTSVVGVLIASHGDGGVRGICPAARVQGCSAAHPRGWYAASAIVDAADKLRPGDIMLVELERLPPGAPRKAPGDTGCVAVEYWSDDFDAIRYATFRGVVVVAAAGNGGGNLDDPFYDTALDGRGNPFKRGSLDSGAVIVGAGAPPGARRAGRTYADRQRLEFSNWGSCVDAQGWGLGVVTTGGDGKGVGALQGGADEDRWYTHSFSGTSSAVPIVAGALACVQGILRASGRPPLAPLEARAALRETGSPQTDTPADKRIGSRPDIGELLAWTEQERPQQRRANVNVRKRKMKIKITIQDQCNGPECNGPVCASAAGSDYEDPQYKGPSIAEIDALTAIVKRFENDPGTAYDPSGYNGPPAARLSQLSDYVRSVSAAGPSSGTVS